MRALTSRIDRARRDVAVGIVLDLSSSTAERIDASATAPPRTNRDGSARRIIDTEREAVALLLRSLARLGDAGWTRWSTWPRWATRVGRWTT